MATLRERIRRQLKKAHPGTVSPGDAGPATSPVDWRGPAPPPPVYLAETPVERSLVPASGRALTRNPEDRKPALIDPQNPPPAPISPAEEATIRGYLDAAQARSTRAGYRADLAHFTSWCEARGLASLPAEPATVARYLADIAPRYKVATLERRLAAISQAHQARGLDTPTRALAVRKVLGGIKRTHGTAQHGKAPVLPADLRAMVAQLDESPAGLRDRALLLLGFAGAFRRSEVVALAVEDLQFRRDGLVVTLRRSKTDQEGEGQTKAIPRGRDRTLCPVRALQAWLAAAQIAEGPVFRPVDRHGNIAAAAIAPFHVARLVKRLAEGAGLDPADYGGHSLRAGLVTAAAQAGAEERDIMRQTGHKSERTLRKYIREADLFRDNAAEGLL